jgi:HSP20 family protein
MNLNNLFPVLRPRKSDPDMLHDLRTEVSRVFDDFNRLFPMSDDLDLTKSGGFIQPKVDVRETEKSIDVVVDVPGVRESDIDVQLDGCALIIKGERSDEKKQNDDEYKIVERSYGSFMRSITLPFEPDSDKVDGTLESGVLTLSIEKPEGATSKVKTVKISCAETSADSANKSGNPATEKQAAEAEPVA